MERKIQAFAIVWKFEETASLRRLRCDPGSVVLQALKISLHCLICVAQPDHLGMTLRRQLSGAILAFQEWRPWSFWRRWMWWIWHLSLWMVHGIPGEFAPGHGHSSFSLSGVQLASSEHYTASPPACVSPGSDLHLCWSGDQGAQQDMGTPSEWWLPIRCGHRMNLLEKGNKAYVPKIIYPLTQK